MAISEDLFLAAKELMPGGVNSPVRAFGRVGGIPPFIESAEGAYVYDADQRQYIDYVGSWGAMVLGHAHPEVVRSVQQVAAKGLSFGAPTSLETRLAQRIRQLVPSMEMLRLVSSGTEATMSAIRLARGYTGRNRIVKFDGCYHGHSDSLLVKAGSGALTLGQPDSLGVPEDIAKLTLTVSFNNLEEVTRLMREAGSSVAAILVEPVAGNMNCVPPLPGFLERLRSLCDEQGSLLIFDEVMTGFRVALGGAQAHYDVRPDLTTLGKIIGGGMPLAAYGGRKEIMQLVAPLGGVYQAGTLSGNPVAVTAGDTTLRLLQEAPLLTQATESTSYLLDGLRSTAKRHGLPLVTRQAGSMFGIFFTDADDVTSLKDVVACDNGSFNRFFHGMLSAGIYLAPSPFEAGFLSAAHSLEDLDATIRAADLTMAKIGNSK